jgi:hypothetical protein
VMELQRCGRTVISTCCTAAARLFDQDALDVTAALGDPFLDAQNATVGAAGI